MADDLAIAVSLRRCSKVRLLRVGEGSSLEISDGKLDVEGLIRRNGVEILRILKLREPKAETKNIRQTAGVSSGAE